MAAIRTIYTASFRGKPFRFVRLERPATLHVFAEDLMRAWDVSSRSVDPTIALLVISSHYPAKHRGCYQTSDGVDHPTVAAAAARRSLWRSEGGPKKPTRSTIRRVRSSLADWLDETEPKARRALFGASSGVQKAPLETPLVSP